MASPYLPSINVVFDFNSGASFGLSMVLDSPTVGLLDTNTLANSSTLAPVVDISSDVQKISIKRGRNLLQDQFEAGTASIRVIDSTGAWNPQNASSPYYPNLVPLRKVRISATYLGVTYWLFSGYTTDYKYSWPDAQNTGYVDITLVDGFRIFNMANVATIPGAINGDLTGQRINDILDLISFPTSMRSIASGMTNLQADPGTNRTALQALKNVEFCEFGAFYMDSQGRAVFMDRSTLIKKNQVTPILFDPVSSVPYSDLTMAFDDKLILNQVNISRIGGATQTATDATSITTYFVHSYTQTNLVLQNDTDAMNIASSYVAARKNSTIRIDSMTLDLCDPASQAAITFNALDLDYFDMVTINNTTPGGSTVSKTLQIHGIDHEIIANKSWLATFETDTPMIDGFILDSATKGKLDTSLLGY